jgi:hypothetical protein
MLVSSTLLKGQINEDAIVQGTAQFIQKRAQANALYVFENSMFSDDKKIALLEKYLPNTKKLIEQERLGIVLMSRTPLIKSLDKDLNENLPRIIFNQLLEKHINVLNDTDSVRIKFLKYAESEIQKPESIEKTDEFIKYRISLLTRVSGMLSGENIAFFKNHTALSIGTSTTLSEEQTKSIVRAENVKMLKLRDSLDFSSVKSEIIALTSSNKNLPNQKAVLDTQYEIPLSRIIFALDSVASIYVKIQAITEDSSYFGRTYSIVNELGILQEDLNSLKKYLYFFAQLADAKSSKEVESILTTTTLPPVSFVDKRRSTSKSF